jgi:hypothetical protein
METGDPGVSVGREAKRLCPTVMHETHEDANGPRLIVTTQRCSWMTRWRAHGA